MPSKGVLDCSLRPVVLTRAEKRGCVGGWSGKQRAPHPAHSARLPQCVGMAMQDSALHFKGSSGGTARASASRSRRTEAEAIARKFGRYR